MPDSGLSTVLPRTGISGRRSSRSATELSFLPSGTRTENPVELFSSQRMQKALWDMKYRYPDRYIIIDMPPVLLFAETKMFSSFVDVSSLSSRKTGADAAHCRRARCAEG